MEGTVQREITERKRKRYEKVHSDCAAFFERQFHFFAGKQLFHPHHGAEGV